MTTLSPLAFPSLASGSPLPDCLVLSHGHTVHPPRNHDCLVLASDVNPVHFKRRKGPTNWVLAPRKEKPEDKLDPESAARGDTEVGGAFRAGIGPCSRTGSARTAQPGHADSGSSSPRSQRWAWRAGWEARGGPESAPPGLADRPTPPGRASGAPLPPSTSPAPHRLRQDRVRE